MARMRDAYNRLVWYKTAICPLCGDTHNVRHENWLAPAKRRVDKDGNIQFHEGYETQFYCRIEQDAVVKQYSPDFRYIGYYIDREIPF